MRDVEISKQAQDGSSYVNRSLMPQCFFPSESEKLGQSLEHFFLHFVYEYHLPSAFLIKIWPAPGREFVI